MLITGGLAALGVAVAPGMERLSRVRLIIGLSSRTVRTADGSLSAHFEHTVAVTPEGPRILTRRSGDSGSKEE